ncbi:MAG: NAD-dependent 4,6-dehydratase LegB [Alicyclobacillus sp.]|uniref:NAD-dependent 4,6-dehydratase LegB n=1 Tax=Alicyclobacillus herbarius TaxID=122960 RepID=UPI0003FB251E|nr:NAD-dependent 4,6-dehydratase LegB [Alicyclobacillus herbarius]MCL6446330.1 NAD-dependent 4,6-dehydratase LegB [Alicyclobacillus sp.]
MKLAHQSVLVTGADGFIGSHLVEQLVRVGADVRAFVFYNSLNSFGWIEHLPKDVMSQIDIVAGDIRDSCMVKEALSGCDTVFHLAALVGVPYSYHAPESYVETNVKGTLNVLQAARDLEIQKVIHTSTSEVYGTARWVPITEEHPLQGQSPYAATKIGADQLALSFHHSFGMPVAILRPFNTYGPRQSLRAVIPTIVAQIASGTTRIRLGALQPTRDFTYVKDTVRGFVAIAESDQSVGQVIQVGSNHEISIGDLVHLIADVMGVDVEVEVEPNRLRPPGSEVERLWADTSKAQQLLGWVPTYGGREGLIRGLQETVAWFTDPTNLRGYKPYMYNL